MSDPILYNAALLSWRVSTEAEKAYKAASAAYHRGGRHSNYQSDWVRPAAYDLSVKQQKWLVSRMEFERKKRLFEKVFKFRWEPPVTETSPA